MKVVTFTREELWALHHAVRRSNIAPDYGQEWDREFLVRVYEGILAVEDRGPDATALMMLTEEDLWQVTRQVNKDYKVGSEPVGRNLLKKVMQAIVELERERRHAIGPYEDDRTARADQDRSYRDPGRDAGAPA